MTRKSEPDEYAARENFPAEIAGTPVVVIQGARFPADDPIVAAHSGKLQTVDEYEQAQAELAAPAADEDE